MSLIMFVIVLVIVGVVLYLIPMDERIKKAIVVIALLVTIAWLLNFFGVVHIPMGRIQ